MHKTPAAVSALASGNLENFIAAATPGGIEAQEKRGQQSFVATQLLPKECPREQLEKLGFVFGTDSDDLFVNVTFPDGWSKQASDHSMWSSLIDPKGRKRASIFYKAAFYDRKARMHGLDCRFSAQHEYKDKDKDPEEYHVVDGADQSRPFVAGASSYEDRQACDELERKCMEWLVANFPQWKDPLAYWD